MVYFLLSWFPKFITFVSSWFSSRVEDLFLTALFVSCRKNKSEGEIHFLFSLKTAENSRSFTSFTNKHVPHITASTFLRHVWSLRNSKTCFHLYVFFFSWVSAPTNSQRDFLSQSDRGEPSMNHRPLRRVQRSVFSSSSCVSDGSDSGDTCPEPPLIEWEWKRGASEGREAHCLMGETHNEATNLQRLSLMVTGQEVPCY